MVSAVAALADLQAHREAPVVEMTPAASRIAVVTVAQAQAGVAAAVVVAVVAGRAPAHVARPPVPVHSRGSVDPARVPHPTVARGVAPASVVMGQVTPGIVRHPGEADRRGPPVAAAVGTPAHLDPRPPGPSAAHLEPHPVPFQGHGRVAQGVVDIGMARGANLVAQAVTPALQAIAVARLAYGEVQATTPVEEAGLATMHQAGALVGHHLGQSFAHDQASVVVAHRDTKRAFAMYVDVGVRRA